MTNDTRDVIARAILHYRGDGPQQDDEEQMAWTILEALAVAGKVIVPKEPTRAMIATALEHSYSRQPLESDVEFVYRAMLAAYSVFERLESADTTDRA